MAVWFEGIPREYEPKALIPCMCAAVSNSLSHYFIQMLTSTLSSTGSDTLYILMLLRALKSVWLESKKDEELEGWRDPIWWAIKESTSLFLSSLVISLQPNK
ncbi:hypothetical protein L484_009817 [Morus notabilis]|uniref:Uncharacterized protein n=1 Tax=Morus notabilis TaxID=981085 RepID=W9S4L1_9ROSA|nr:hypothetical protein L484_009817 [Morus notabilis]